MCGRFTLAEDWSMILEMFGIAESMVVYEPRYNIAPTQTIPTIISDGQRRRMGPLKWGLIPSFATDTKSAYKMINARAETLMERPAFRNLIRRKRCLIPADGFYEWQRIGDKKQPMRIVLRDRNLFSFAGLYDVWVSPEGEKIHTCTIITTEANELMKPIHDRMPVILSPEAETAWLDRTEDEPDRLLPFLKPYPAEQMRAYPVSNRVGNVRNDDAGLINEVEG